MKPKTKAIKYGAVIACVLLLVGIDFADSAIGEKQNYGRIGRAVPFTAISFPFSTDQQAEIVQYGLEDPRGVAVTSDGKVLVTERNRPILVFPDQGSTLVSECHLASGEREYQNDLRGLAVEDQHLFVADRSQARISRTDLSVTQCPSASADTYGCLDKLQGPTGLSAVGDELFFTINSDPSNDGKTCPSKSLGELLLSQKLKPPQSIDTGLTDPSGVVALSKTGPVIVADRHCNSEVRWHMYRKECSTGKWVKQGDLGAVPTGNARIASFLGIDFDAQQRIYAAGPDGIYVFSIKGEPLGKISVDVPVSGVSVQGSNLYFAAGDALCRIQIECVAWPLARCESPKR